MRWAIGLIAGPDRPAYFIAVTVVLVLRSIRIALKLLIKLIPSAPPASEAFAISAISVTFGVSFINIGSFVTSLTALVILSAILGSAPNADPPCSTLGQLIFTSSISA